MFLHGIDMTLVVREAQVIRKIKSFFTTPPPARGNNPFQVTPIISYAPASLHSCQFTLYAEAKSRLHRVTSVRSYIYRRRRIGRKFF